MGGRSEITPGAAAYAAVDIILATQRREEIEIAVEALIAALDRRDADPDLEPDNDAEDDDPAGGNVEDEGEADYSDCESGLPLIGGGL